MSQFNPTLLLYIPVFLFSLTFHEFAHAWTAKKAGDLTAAYLGRLTFSPMAHIDPIGTILLPAISLFSGIPLIGWAKPVPINHLRFRHSIWLVWVSLAGPASNLIIVAAITLILKLVFVIGGAGALSSFRHGVQGGTMDPLGISALLSLMFIQLNIVLALFNLLPIPPLDGSKVFYHFFVRGRAEMSPVWVSVERFGLLFLMLAITIRPVQSLLAKAYTLPFYAILQWLGL